MSNPIEFYFDFSSPYGYLASEKIDELAARFARKVLWRPVLLGVIFRATGGAPLTTLPLKGRYSLHDFSRSARFLGVPYVQPEKFPLPTQQAARAYYWLHDQDCAAARAFAHAVYRAFFRDGRDVSETGLVLELAAQQGADRATLAAALEGAELKERLKAENDAALQKGVFGSPYIVVDGEPFFGADRLPQIERWLATGGF
ncbi:MAG TPA: 2-hydroxychromene-2-carboxylate isomerase [Accumulibacter sp.]|uniref:2-hydroxychromene-2-carboxylate isomerase n=1 Tax=Accumulibacter sp. TaxID=2053492 RepID=UPI0026096311|nr:2-hydroxychromene-2-carboxylate isomerase [Accumulibacter sp.]MDS4015392.1 2-hydroxychromene-2-carboxylate isomerase [Accumulibacter sp.]HMV06807.1 2-hydroxychromene-2-carboxylate isomerase [Accumulibacter sp.]HMW62582.1 2-hydroxychromene-2-carboxylate isomerase [Accumulibacter sp.]HMW79774.1 2-hydroxychromene-2-carboxylate isomerase [Accumulibacter sp.]HMX68476.1 2-hydroxychromene-2-carboxylate isomerase [Accumulibacter sp.]